MRVSSFMRCGVLIGKLLLEGKVCSVAVIFSREWKVSIKKGKSFDKLWAKAELAFLS
jgi:hypothetical protein